MDKQDEIWAEVSTLEAAAPVTSFFHFYEAKLTSLKLKTRPKQLAGSLTLDILAPKEGKVGH
jgi:hypothetical protein